jgi:hypothetical protein
MSLAGTSMLHSFLSCTGALVARSRSGSGLCSFGPMLVLQIIFFGNLHEAGELVKYGLYVYLNGTMFLNRHALQPDM